MPSNRIDPAIDALEVARTGTAYLAGLVDADGKFKYRFNHATGKPAKDYNIVRHCGTLWAMLNVQRSIGAGDEIVPAARRASAHLIDTCLRFHRDIDAVTICTENRISLGANALGILALLGLGEITGDALIQRTTEKIGEFILANRRDDGEFIHRLYFESGRISGYHNQYYTGEGLLALLALFETTGDERWLDAVVERENALCREDYGVTNQSHWMLYALDKLSRYRKDKAYYDHAAKIARHILDHPDYREWNRCTPIACRSEGLLAFLRMTRDGGAGKKLRDACLSVTRGNLNLQLGFRRADGAFVGGGDKTKERYEEMRIDYVAHNTMAFLRYHLDGHGDLDSGV